jgi:hypothetical protein
MFTCLFRKKFKTIILFKIFQVAEKILSSVLYFFKQKPKWLAKNPEALYHFLL